MKITLKIFIVYFFLFIIMRPSYANSGGYIADPIDRSYLQVIPPASTSASPIANVKADNIPSKYDLRDYERVSPVKNQDPWGTCWVFASMASLESSFLTQRMGKALDLSEFHLAWYTYMDQREGHSYTMTIGDEPLSQLGGYSNVAVAILSRLPGLVLEEKLPYPNTGDYIRPSAAYPEDPCYAPFTYRLLHKYDFGNLDNPNKQHRIKQIIMEHGAVFIAYNAGKGATSAEGNTTTAYFDGKSEGVNHAVVIVGWDDDYSRENFNEDDSLRPQNNGAWLIKNSWGEDRGDDGYFYISYEQYIEQAAAFVIGDTIPNMKVYYHDALGYIDEITENYAANIFCAERDETLKQVSFYTTDINADYEVTIYRLGNRNPGTPTPDTKKLAAGKLGSLPYAGYHTVDIGSVALKKGEYFSVVVKLVNPSHKYPFAVETEAKQKAVDKKTKQEFVPYHAKPVVHANESYVSVDGVTWKDTAAYTGTTLNMTSDRFYHYNGAYISLNVCIKAFTTASSNSTEDDDHTEDPHKDDTELSANTFPDEKLLSYLQRFDTDKNGSLSAEEIAQIQELRISSMHINSLEGIDKLTALTYLYCSDNNLSELDLSKCYSLKQVDCSSNQIKNLNVAALPSLESLRCTRNDISELDVSECTSLTYLNVNNNPISSLNLNHCTSFITLTLTGTALSRLNAGNCTSMTDINCSNNDLVALNVSGCSALKELNCSSNQLTELDVTSCSALEKLYCKQNSLQFLWIKGLKTLAYIDCSENSLQNLELSGCSSLVTLICSSNALSSFDISPCSAMINLDISDNALEEFSAPNMTSLKVLKCGGNKITILDLHGCQSLADLRLGSNLRSVDISNCTSLGYFGYTGNHYGSKGTLEYLNASGCTSIDAINCNDNVISSIDVTGCSFMNTFNCNDNMITSIKISGCDALKYLKCQNNPLHSLVVANAPSLESLRCDNTSLDVLDVSGCSVLDTIYCYNSLIKSFNFSGCSSLKNLYCQSNDLHTVDLSNCVSLQVLNARFNHLPYIELPRWFDANLHGQTISGYSLSETGDSLWPYKFDFRQCVPEDKISNIVSHDKIVGTSQKRVQGYNGSTAIYTSYKDGVAQFSSKPTRIYYCYNADYRHYDSNSSLMDVSIILSDVNVTPSPQEPTENSSPDNSSGEETPRDTTPGGTSTDGNSGSNAIPEGITGNIRSILGIDENVPVQNLTKDNANIGTDRKDNTVRYADGLRVLAMLPEIQVYADGVYIIPVSFDTPAHLGEYLTWHPFYDDGDSNTFSSSRNEVCVFLNEDGSELTMPLTREIDYLKVATYLETGKVYSPAVFAETSNTNTKNPSTSSGGGGCEAFTTLWTLFAVFIIVMKKNV